MKTFTVIDENKIMVDDKLFIHLEDEKPTFSVGQWVIGNKSPLKPLQPCLITKIEGHLIFYNENGNETYQAVGIRPATQQEIELHLRKICDEKYIGKKVKCLESGCSCNSRTNIVSYFKRFNLDDNVMYYNCIKGFEIVVYKEGKFAEIIPNKKKDNASQPLFVCREAQSLTIIHYRRENSIE
jgi:hypothetical protein